jgi:hypothetical protein
MSHLGSSVTAVVSEAHTYIRNYCRYYSEIGGVPKPGSTRKEVGRCEAANEHLMLISCMLMRYDLFIILPFICARLCIIYITRPWLQIALSPDNFYQYYYGPTPATRRFRTSCHQMQGHESINYV